MQSEFTLLVNYAKKHIPAQVRTIVEAGFGLDQSYNETRLGASILNALWSEKPGAFVDWLLQDWSERSTVDYLHAVIVWIVTEHYAPAYKRVITYYIDAHRAETENLLSAVIAADNFEVFKLLYTRTSNIWSYLAVDSFNPLLLPALEVVDLPFRKSKIIAYLCTLGCKFETRMSVSITRDGKTNIQVGAQTRVITLADLDPAIVAKVSDTPADTPVGTTARSQDSAVNEQGDSGAATEMEVLN